MTCYRGLALVIACVGWLSGCVTNTIETPVAINLEEREAQLRALTEFEFDGGLGIWTDEESISARVNWIQQGENLRVNLTGPLGIGDLRLNKNAQNAKLTRGGKLVASGQSADAVLQRGLGLSAPVPLEQLQMWVRGLEGNAQSVVRDPKGQLMSVRFKDTTGTAWQARFKRYTSIDNMSLPALVTASGGPYSVRLIIKNWQIGNAATVPEMQQSNKRLPIPGR